MQNKLGRKLAVNKVVELFNACFAASTDTLLTDTTCNTYLIPMANEPIYLPSHVDPRDFLFEDVQASGNTRSNDISCANEDNRVKWLGKTALEKLPDGNLIFFNRDYLASALHEVSHWCIAGEARRQQVDYGYWYTPDTRNKTQQIEFEAVEVKPQAVEWALSIACGKAFKVSCDNLLLQNHDLRHFELNVSEQLNHYLQHGFPQRAQMFIEILSNCSQMEMPTSMPEQSTMPLTTTPLTTTSLTTTSLTTTSLTTTNQRSVNKRVLRTC